MHFATSAGAFLAIQSPDALEHPQLLLPSRNGPTARGLLCGVPARTSSRDHPWTEFVRVPFATSWLPTESTVQTPDCWTHSPRHVRVGATVCPAGTCLDQTRLITLNVVPGNFAAAEPGEPVFAVLRVRERPLAISIGCDRVPWLLLTTVSGPSVGVRLWSPVLCLVDRFSSNVFEPDYPGVLTQRELVSLLIFPPVSSTDDDACGQFSNACNLLRFPGRGMPFVEIAGSIPATAESSVPTRPCCLDSV